MNLYSTVLMNINLIEHFFWGGEGVFLVLKGFYQFYTYFGSRVELVTKIPKSTPVSYAQLGILGAMFASVPVVALTATATEKTNIKFPWNGGARDNCSQSQQAEHFLLLFSTTKYW